MIPDTAAQLAAHRRLRPTLPGRIQVMVGSGATDADDEPAERGSKPRESALTLAGFPAGTKLRVRSGRFAGELVVFDKCAGMRNDTRVLRIKRANGTGGVVLATDVVQA